MFGFGFWPLLIGWFVEKYYIIKMSKNNVDFECGYAKIELGSGLTLREVGAWKCVNGGEDLLWLNNHIEFKI